MAPAAGDNREAKAQSLCLTASLANDNDYLSTTVPAQAARAVQARLCPGFRESEEVSCGMDFLAGI